MTLTCTPSVPTEQACCSVVPVSLRGTQVQIATPRARINVNGFTYDLSPAERQILDRLGGKPVNRIVVTDAKLRAARETLTALANALGMKSVGWFTDGKANSKFAKSGLPTVGVTLHAHTSAAVGWKHLTCDERDVIADILGVPIPVIGRELGTSVCPRSTSGCRCSCVTNESYHSLSVNTQRSRLVKDLFTRFRPDLALVLTAHELRRNVKRAGGPSKARWRVNVSDDIRWEVLAPGLLRGAPRAYAYTKFRPHERFSLDNLSVVYSASEYWSDSDIVDACTAGHRVAVVFNVPKGKLPKTWKGVPVVNGDDTDDLWSHPAGVIVGLRLKGQVKEKRKVSIDRGFARPPV